MNRFRQVKDILDNAVGGPDAFVGAHGPFWRVQSRDEFVAIKVFNLPLVSVGDGSGSNIVKALRGELPFGDDPNAEFPQMPFGFDPVPPEQIDFISAWIDDRCPEEIGALEALLGGAPSGSAVVAVSAGATPTPAQLSLRTTDGSQGDVTIRVAAGSVATLEVSPTTAHVSGTATHVDVVATTPSASANDTTIEVVQGSTVLASVALTAVADDQQ